MNAAFQWLGDLFRWFGKWVPALLIVRSTHAGVRFVRGHDARLLTPGLHVYWPIVTEVEVYPQVRQTANLPTQCLLTADGHEVVAGGIVVYRVKDMLRLLTATFNPDETITDHALAAIKAVVTTKQLEELRTEQQAVDDALTRELNGLLARPFGVEVLRCCLSDFSTCVVLKVVGIGGPAIGD